MSIFGNRGKLSARLKKIKVFKKKKNKKEILPSEEEQSNLKNYNNVLKVISSIPLLVCSGLTTKTDTKNEKNNIKVKDNKFSNNGQLKLASDGKKQKLEMIAKINVSQNKPGDYVKNTNGLVAGINVETETLKDNKKVNNFAIKETKNNQLNLTNDINLDNHFDKDTKYNYKEKCETLNIEEKKYSNVSTEKINNSQEEVNNLEKKILNRIKKILIKMVNEYEILESELFIISNATDDNKKYLKCKETVDQIKDMLCRIDKLKAKYDFLKDNFDFEYMLEIDDNFLADDIIELKNKFSTGSVKNIVTDYKLLDVYKYLYMRIDKLEDETVEYNEYKNQQLEELKKRDINFDKLSRDVYNLDNAKDSYDRFVREEEKTLEELNQKLFKIDSHEVINFELVGFNELLKNSFKYLGLLMVNPLKGVIPSIATKTVITANVVENLYHNLHWEEKKRLVYETIDFSSEINSALSDLDLMNGMVDKTLEQLAIMKDGYNKQFKKYQNDFTSYNDVINKINDMENKILGNKIKIEIMKKRTIEKQRINDQKLHLVKKLNKSEIDKQK